MASRTVHSSQPWCLAPEPPGVACDPLRLRSGSVFPHRNDDENAESAPNNTTSPVSTRPHALATVPNERGPMGWMFTAGTTSNA